jgi:hypothetical protein
MRRVPRLPHSWHGRRSGSPPTALSTSTASSPTTAPATAQATSRGSSEAEVDTRRASPKHLATTGWSGTSAPCPKSSCTPASSPASPTVQPRLTFEGIAAGQLGFEGFKTV